MASKQKLATIALVALAVAIAGYALSVQERLWELQATRAELEAEIQDLKALIEELEGRLEALGAESEEAAPSCPVIALLPDELYYPAIERLIERANHSIYVAMFVMKYDPNEPSDPVNLLLEELVEARERGLDVRVLVDDVTYESYRATVELLEESGVPVRLDPGEDVRTHVKMVIVDGKHLVVGSHNWTESALSYNNEFSVLITSEEHAKQALQYFEKLWAQGRAP